MPRPTASAIRSRLLVAAIGASLLGLASGREAGAQELPPITPPDTSTRLVGVLRPGDLLMIKVHTAEELTGEYLIDAQGLVQIPGLGDVRVAGLSPEGVKRRLADQMVERGIGTPDIAVTPVVRLSVLGEVLTPGQQRVEPGTTLLQLLTIAGGLTDRADVSEARVLRDGKAYPVDIRGALEGRGGNVTLFSNDVLVVPRRGGLTRENLMFVLSAASVILSVTNVLLALR